jgi:hypothetical protein
MDMNLISLRYNNTIQIIPRFFAPVLGEQFQMKKSGEITLEVDTDINLPWRAPGGEETSRQGG